MKVSEFIEFLKTCDSESTLETVWSCGWDANSQEPILQKNILVEPGKIIILCE